MKSFTRSLIILISGMIIGFITRGMLPGTKFLIAMFAFGLLMFALHKANKFFKKKKTE